MDGLYQTQRIKDLKDKMLSEPRYASIEQALIITKTYQGSTHSQAFPLR